MMKRILTAVATVALLLIAVYAPFAPCWARPPAVAAPQGIARLLQPFVDNHTLAGAVTLAASRDKVLSLEAVGYADLASKRPMQTDSLFWIASMTKPIKPSADKKGLEETKIASLTYPLSDRKRAPLPAGGLFSTASDLSVFCRMVFCGGTLDGKRYLSEKAVRQMTALSTRSPMPPRGLGWAASASPSGPFGHGGAYKTNMLIDPEHQLVTVFLVQHAVWSDEGKKILPAFLQAATKAFGVAPAPRPVNKLTDAQRAAGWKLLFDGQSTRGWRNFKKPDVSPGWQVIDGALCRVAKGAGDLITAEQYANFELELDYQVPPHANSGIMYRVSEDETRAPFTGVEYQILDNTDPKGDPQKAGWAYALYQPPLDPKTGKPVDATRPVGQWNHVRLVCNGPHVEHWMNGVKYCAYEIGSDDWKRRVTGTKFAKWPKFAQYKVGHIALQGDHGDVSFANIKLRPLPAK